MPVPSTTTQYDFSAFDSGSYDFSAFKPPPDSDSIGFGDVLKSGAAGIADVIGGALSGFASGDPVSAPGAAAANAGVRAAHYLGGSDPRTGRQQAALSAIPAIGPQIADLAGPSLAYASGRPPSKQENLAAVRSGTGAITALAAPTVAGRIAARTPAAAPSIEPSDPSTTAQPFYGEEGARGPLDTTFVRPPPPPPTKLQQAAGALRTGVQAVRHPLRTGVTTVADIVANRLSPAASTAHPLPPPSTPTAVDGLQLAGDVPADVQLPPSAIPTPRQVALARAVIAKHQALSTPPDASALPSSQMQPTSDITATTPPTTIPTSSRQIALNNSVEDYTTPTESQIPAPRRITRKTGQLEINGEPVGSRVPFSSQLPQPTPAIEAARMRAEAAFQRQIHTSMVARDTMQSKSFPQWASDEQQEFGRAVQSGDAGTAAAISSAADQRSAGIPDPAYGAISHLPDHSMVEIYNGGGIYIDPDGKITQIKPEDFDE